MDVSFIGRRYVLKADDYCEGTQNTRLLSGECGSCDTSVNNYFLSTLRRNSFLKIKQRALEIFISQEA